MEFTAWFTHKYIMHGILWGLHKDHHQKPKNQKYEKNDWFFLMFASPSFLLLYFGYNQGSFLFSFWIGFGIALYGITYTVVHEIFIHQRIKIFRKTNNFYFLKRR